MRPGSRLRMRQGSCTNIRKHGLYLISGQTVHISTDYQKCLYVFAPLALRPNSPIMYSSGYMEGQLPFLDLNFELNTSLGQGMCAQIYLLEGRKYIEMVTYGRKISRAICPNTSLIRGSKNASYDGVKHKQSKYSCAESVRTDLRSTEKPEEWIWIPSESIEFKSKVIESAHCVERGHKAYKVASGIINKSF